MEVNFLKFKNRPIIHEDKTYGFLVGLKIDKDTGKISSILNNKYHCYKAEYVTEWEESIKLSSIKNCEKVGENWITFRVYTRDGKYLGFVTDYYFETNILQISRIVIQRSFFGLFKFPKRIISAKRIFNVKRRRIIVDVDMRNVSWQLADYFSG